MENLLPQQMELHGLKELLALEQAVFLLSLLQLVEDSLHVEKLVSLHFQITELHGLKHFQQVVLGLQQLELLIYHQTGHILLAGQAVN